MNRPRTLYISDLDGTLLDADARLSDYTVKSLNELGHAGALVTFATARTPATVVEIFKDVRLNIPGIVMTGAATYDTQTGCYSDVTFLNRSTVEKALGVFSEQKISCFVYTLAPDNILHAYHPAPLQHFEESFYRLRRDMKLKRFHIEEAPDAVAMDHTVLMFSIVEREAHQEAVENLHRAIGYPVTYYNDVVSGNLGFIEIFGRGVSKAHSIQELKKKIGADRVVAFGDNLNDLSMFGVADVSVAVENAFDEVKEAADIIIGANTTDSVVQFIKKDFFRE